MSQLISPLRKTGIVLGSFALALTAGAACSPLSLSQSKLHSAPGAPAANPITPGNPTAVTPIGRSDLGPNQQAANLTNVAVSVKELSEHQLETSTLPREQRLSITADNDAEALDSFKATRSVTIHFGGRAPEECKTYFGLTMTETMISNYGWNSSVSPIATDCAALPDGNWKVSVSASVSQDTWSQLAPSLAAVTIFVANHPRMSVVNPAPGVSPAPAQPQSPVRISPR